MSKTRNEAGSTDLDLVPIMNMVTILIPFLLLSVQFVSIAVIDTTLPAISDETPPEKPAPEEQLLLTLLLDSAGLHLTSNQPTEAPPQHIPCTAPCATQPDYDWDALKTALSAVKQDFPHEETLMLQPDGDVSYELLIAAMDASRVDGAGADLFPQVVIAGGRR